VFNDFAVMMCVIAAQVAVIAASETPSITVDTRDNDPKDMKQADNDATANIKRYIFLSKITSRLRAESTGESIILFGK